MAKNFTIVNENNISYNMKTLEKASATVIAPGSLVEVDSWGLAIIGTATATLVAYCPMGWVAGETSIQVIGNPEVTFKGTASWNYAKANRNIMYEIAVSTYAQTINLSWTTKPVARILASTEANNGVAVGATPVVFKIPASYHLFG